MYTFPGRNLYRLTTHIWLQTIQATTEEAITATTRAIVDSHPWIQNDSARLQAWVARPPMKAATPMNLIQMKPLKQAEREARPRMVLIRRAIRTAMILAAEIATIAADRRTESVIPRASSSKSVQDAGGKHKRRASGAPFVFPHPYLHRRRCLHVALAVAALPFRKSEDDYENRPYD